MNRNNSTDRVHAAIKSYWAKHGISPTMLELARICGFASNSVVMHHIDKLVEQGLVTHEKGRRRTLVLTRWHKRPLEQEAPRRLTVREEQLDAQADYWQSRGDILIWKQNKGGTYSGFDVIHEGAGIVASSA